jgi:hypothetical protein
MKGHDYKKYPEPNEPQGVPDNVEFERNETPAMERNEQVTKLVNPGIGGTTVISSNDPCLHAGTVINKDC